MNRSHVDTGPTSREHKQENHGSKGPRWEPNRMIFRKFSKQARESFSKKWGGVEYVGWGCIHWILSSPKKLLQNFGLFLCEPKINLTCHLPSHAFIEL